MNTDATIALIPTTESNLYDSFGIDLMTADACDSEGNCETYMAPIEWIELGDFPRDEDGDVEVKFDKAMIRRLEDALPNHRFLWSTLVDDRCNLDYAVVEIEALD